TIRPLSPLPAVTDALTLDGTKQPGYRDRPLIELDGSGAGRADGLVIRGGATVRGLAINRFALNGINVDDSGATVEACYLGTNAAGDGPAGNGGAGILAVDSGLTVGGATAATRNVISGNDVGVSITSRGPADAYVSVAGNYIG